MNKRRRRLARRRRNLRRRGIAFIYNARFDLPAACAILSAVFHDAVFVDLAYEGV